MIASLKIKTFGLKISEIGSNGTFCLAIVFQHFPHGTDTRKESIRKFASELLVGRRELKHIIESLSKMIKIGQWIVHHYTMTEEFNKCYLA